MSAHHLRDLQCKRASRSMHSQVYVFGCFFRCRSWTCPRRFWSPTWPQLEPMLEPCWPLFGTFLGVLLASQLKIAFKTIFCRFWTSWGMKNVQKPLVFVGRNEAACFCAMIALETDLGPILAPFWNPKSIQNQSRNG